jgi:polyisoprenyl-phosphate glycosyltransferase
MNKAKVVVVTPIYEDVESARLLFRDLRERISDLRIVAVDDGSVYHPVESEVLDSLKIKGAVIKLRRNLGHQGAIAVGLCYVHAVMRDYDCVIVMDSDGEDTPESIHELLQGFLDSEADVRVAERKKRKESFKFILLYWVYKFLFRVLTGKIIYFGNFMVLKPRSVARLSAMNEIWIHLAASVMASKLRIERRKIDRGVRYVGGSKMGFLNLVLHGFKGVMVFSEQVLIRMGGASLMVGLASAAVILVAIVLKMIDAASPGWLSTVIGSTVVIFLQTSVLTFITLMITGIVRVSTFNQIDFNSFVDQVIEVE